LTQTLVLSAVERQYRAIDRDGILVDVYLSETRDMATYACATGTSIGVLNDDSSMPSPPIPHSFWLPDLFRPRISA
jgi:hypothetical protein